MTNPLHAPYYADQAQLRTVSIAENVQIARDTYRVRLHCPEVARQILPGQFVMLRLVEGDDPLLGRPLALYDTVLDQQGIPVGIDVVYLVVGKLTGRLARLSVGENLELWGPLGNGFEPQRAKHLVIVAGGIGQTPFVAMAREVLGQRTYGEPARDPQLSERVTLCYGARNREYHAGVEDFEQLGVDVRLSTDDGSVGHHGLVTDLLRELLSSENQEQRENRNLRVVCCGPEPMMEAVAKIAAQAAVPCRVSLETPMACGIGICFSCVVKVVQDDGDWDYKRSCVEGPVFAAERIVW